VDEQGPEPRAGGSGRHDPDQGGDGRRHQRGHPRREHRWEQRRQRPHRGSGRQAAPAAPFLLPALEPAEEVEEQRDGPVGAGHERDGARVVPRPVDGKRRVAGQRREAELGEGAVASKVHGRQAEAEHDCTSWERLLGAATEDASRTRQNPTTTMKLRFHRAIYRRIGFAKGG